jgi:hypothetical protein
MTVENPRIGRATNLMSVELVSTLRRLRLLPAQNCYGGVIIAGFLCPASRRPRARTGGASLWICGRGWIRSGTQTSPELTGAHLRVRRQAFTHPDQERRFRPEPS